MYTRAAWLPYYLRMLLVLATLLCNRASWPQTQSQPNPQQLARHAGYIFSGRVLRVQRLPAAHPGELASVAITFRVLQGMRGVRSGQLLTIRQWAALWDLGERYTPGQNVTLFLYPPSKLGLTSAVGGSWGRFVRNPGGQAFVGRRRPRGWSREDAAKLRPRW